MEKPLGSFADLLARHGVTVSDTPPEPKPPAPQPAKPDTIDLTTSAKLVVRRERKGRGGKTATVIAGLVLRPQAMEHIAKELRRALGCGATVDDATIIVQGDLTTRVATWLGERGAKRVVIGN